jgi:hypothetical protein
VGECESECECACVSMCMVRHVYSNLKAHMGAGKIVARDPEQLGGHLGLSL